MVDRVLKMLDQYLISNQSLKLDETFKIYLKVLSIEHMKYKEKTKGRTHLKRTKKFYKKHYGARVKPVKKYNYFWAIDVPDSYSSEPYKNVFKNKCFLTCTILSILQNEYYKSERKDTRYLYAQNINSVCKKKKNHAGNLILKELDNLLKETNLPKNGPYELETTSRTLHKFFNCQFFIFDSIDNSNKISFMYPEIYDDSLIPIYLYQPLDEPNHVVFIRHLNSYFKSNVKVCFACKKIFLTHNYNHLCKKTQCCFSCRRFFLTEKTYIHERLLIYFCDKKTTSQQSFLCELCNVTCYSEHCYKGHKLICSGKGTFGYKCLKCNKFTYRYGNLNGIQLKDLHTCGNNKLCKFCREEKTENHLCKLIKDIIPHSHSKLAFIGMEHFDNSYETCINCLNLKMNSDSCELKDLYCEIHRNYNTESEPCLAIIYCEQSNFMYKKFTINHFNIEPEITTEDISLASSKYTFNCSTKNSSKKMKQSEDFKRNFKILQEKNHFLLLDKLLQLITSSEWSNTTFICQDSDSRCYMSILKAFIRNGFCPVVVRNGRKILLLEIKPLKLRFITINSYFDGNEYDFAELNNLSFDQYFFPKLFLNPLNVHYQGEIPDERYFLSILDSDLEETKKNTFITSFKKNKLKWNFQKELLTYCDQKVFLLTLSCLNFITESLNFQTQLKTYLKISNDQFLYPFSYPLCSLGGFVYKLYKVYYSNHYDLYAIDHEYGISSKNVSKVEYEWCCYMQFLYPEKNFISAFNNPSGQKYFKEAVPDLYSPVSKQAYFFNGCVFHGHFENCLLNPKATESTKNPFGITFKELNASFLEKMQNLLTNNPNDINEVVIRWECHYKKIREDQFMQNFLRTQFRYHPLIRLKPRSCVRGAFFDVYALRWSKMLFPNQKMYYLDINGLYSSCAINFKYMVGKYFILLGEKLNDIHIINNKFFYQNKPILGSMLVTILPPKDLRFPFLLYRTTIGETINTLCKTCSEKKIKKCQHSDMERALTASYMISEIEFALSLGYKLLFLHECHFYEKSDYILREFVQILNFLKTSHSNCLENCKTFTEKEKYCQFLNNEMYLFSPFLLTPSNVKLNKSKRNFFKLMANSLFGKLEQRNDKPKTLYVSNQSELEDIFFSENKITDIFCVNDQMCQVEITPNELKLPPNRKTNCYIGAQLTAYARETIYKHLQTLIQTNADIFQIDCDSIIFALSSSVSIPLPISDSVGHFKHEIDGEIFSFYSLGPKNYSITFCKNDRIQTMSKVRGLSLNNSLSKNILTDELFEFYVNQFVNGTKESLSLKQFRVKGNFKKMKISSEIENVTFTNSLFNRRILCNPITLNYSTYPYGIKE
jgi:hypothetical protein